MSGRGGKSGGGDRPAVLLTRPVSECVLAPLRGRFEFVGRLDDETRPLSPAEIRATLGQVDAVVIIGNIRCDAELVGEAAEQRVKIIANHGVGVDHIDLAAASRCGVWVTNTPDVLTDATADLTMGLILAAMRRLGEGERYLRANRRTSPSPSRFFGRDPRGKQLGVIGLGRIGQAVARRAVAFGMRIAYCDPVARPGAEAEIGAKGLTLEELLRTSDVVTIHCPMSEGTRGLIGAGELALMKQGAFLINAARGGIVDEAALVAALRSGQLGGAALDVYSNEGRICRDLLYLPNVTLTPHMGSATVETRRAMAELTLANVEAVLSGGRPITPVAGPGFKPGGGTRAS